MDLNTKMTYNKRGQIHGRSFRDRPCRGRYMNLVLFILGMLLAISIASAKECTKPQEFPESIPVGPSVFFTKEEAEKNGFKVAKSTSRKFEFHYFTFTNFNLCTVDAVYAEMSVGENSFKTKLSFNDKKDLDGNEIYEIKTPIGQKSIFSIIGYCCDEWAAYKIDF